MPKQKSNLKRKKKPSVKRLVKVSLTKRLARFIPALLLFGLSAYMGVSHASPLSSPHSVLSYATSVNATDLLTSTNTQRANGAIGNLVINSQLMSAAQAKANDMVSRDYWSHVTPDGKQPWDFMTAAGYSYKAAGENLAYGFATSADTVTGWMNSPPHRENLMNSVFQDVGFGIADSPNFVSNGQQTIVVAMYGAQAGASSPAPVASTPPSTPAVQSATPKTPVAQAEAQPISDVPVVTEPVPVETTPSPTSEPVKTTPEAAPASKPIIAVPTKVSRIQVITAGSAQWSTTLLIASTCAIGLLWVFQRGFQIKRLVLAGEHFFLSHAHIDMAFLGLLTLGWTLLQTSGVIR